MASSYFKLKILSRKKGTRKRKQAQLTQMQAGNIKEKPSFPLETGVIGIHECRICLKKGNIPIYGDETAPDISQSVKSFGDIEMSEVDGFPNHICDACYSLLQNAILFRKTAKEADTFLHENTQRCVSLPETVLSDVDYDLGPDNDTFDEATDKTYKCKLCTSNFKTLDEYSNHKSSKQHRNIRIQCPICHGLLTAQLYRRHLARHQSVSHLICEICGKMYRKDNLVRHLQLHSFELPFQCQICPYRGRFLESLKIHMRTHTGTKPFACDSCQLCFLTRSNLNRHLLTHKKDKPHKCIECGRGFYLKRDLDVHFKSDHAGIKDFGCQLCGNTYGTRKALMRHELRVHKRNKMAKGRMPLYLQAEYRKQFDECK